ncbi:MAG: D-glycero-beta-D-manno-heptose-7-phosphate kinase [Elusimicrobiaceae bacterium]|nr:D-glycero-beta-D-manno-heptose-7-phosphate kinase [Elusimicrobiaceae bacterium]
MKNTDKNRLKTLVSQFKNRKVIVFGDIMIDHFVRGSVSRISPEAPVPVVHVREEAYLPGGAGNVAANMARLGGDVTLLSVVGNDIAGEKLLDGIGRRGIHTALVVRDGRRPTTEKVRVIAEHQQVVRFDREATDPLGPELAQECIRNMESAIKNAGAVILSDYGKGVLNDTTIEAAIKLCRRHGVPVCVDPKVGHFKKYRNITCMTPNTKEACEGMGVPVTGSQKELEALGGTILEALNAQSLLITQGAGGMTLFENGNQVEISHTGTVAREVYDVTGAGDTVISVLALSLAAGATLKEAAMLSNYAAGVVVGKLGTATVTPEELARAIR